MARRAAEPRWYVILAERWKAVVGLLVPLVGGLVALFPESRAWQVAGVVVVAVASGVGVHQIPNRPHASVVGAAADAVDGVLDPLDGDRD